MEQSPFTDKDRCVTTIGVMLIFGLLLGLGLIFKPAVSQVMEIAQNALSEEVIPTIPEGPPPRVKPEKIIAKGLYLTGYSANNPKKRKEIIDLINSTELNSVVVDIKDYTGYILYERDDEDSGLWISKNILKDPKAAIDDFHNAGIYVLARQTVFQDPVLAETKPDLSIKHTSGGIWHDYKGLSWVDPTKREVWEYNVDIAKHAISLGFDEINFDYVRFPSDGNMSTVVYSRDKVLKTQVMREFYKYLSDELKDEPAHISLDLFGLTLDNNEFDLNIGQRMRDTLDLVDYVCPMTYPSHYPEGYLGFQNPANHPYEVISNGLSIAQDKFATSTAKAKLRPWLQAFNIGAVYDGAKIRAQISAVEDSENTAGWFLWNARNVYSSKGLKSVEVE